MASTISRRASQLKKPKESATRKRSIGNTDITEKTGRRNEIAMDTVTDTTATDHMIETTTAMMRMDTGTSDHDIREMTMTAIITAARNIHDASIGIRIRGIVNTTRRNEILTGRHPM